VVLVPRDAGAQPTAPVGNAQARSLAKACGRTGRLSDCVALMRGRLARVADAILAELQTPVAAATLPAGTTSRAPERGVVWDGTFAHPNARSFYTLRGYVPANMSGNAVCAQLPAQVRADPNLLLKLTCRAEQELLAAGPGRWPEEMAELQRIRTALAACLPTGSATAPCSTP
jgi:hypothetical protein